MSQEETQWFDDYAEDVDEIQIEEYDITAAPNDFNILTIYNFLESGAVREDQRVRVVESFHRSDFSVLSRQ